MPHIMREARGAFGSTHTALMGQHINFSTLRPEDFSPSLIEEAQAVWAERTRTEFRSVQILNRLLADVLAAGDPIDVYAAFHDFVGDEIRHVALCAQMTRALGAEPRFPAPLPLPSAPNADAPAAERALGTAITMLAVSETLSVGFIRDLAARCTEPAVSAVLHATLADEGAHQDLGWSYVKLSLRRFPPSTLPAWGELAKAALADHQRRAQSILASLPANLRHVDSWPDEQRVQLGLFGPERQALVFERTVHSELLPRLRECQLVG